ncbi:MAG TPA: hypothetical protein VHV30_05960 [Polyangiaceae bacterium]|jgi:hypothetical protein|nr:hypothetical protein [Polyangiaceae bacterium]
MAFGKTARTIVLAGIAMMIAACDGEVALNGLEPTPPPDEVDASGEGPGDASVATKPDASETSSHGSGDQTSVRPDGGTDVPTACKDTCTGCCDDNDVCQWGDAVPACGELGARCAVCTGTSPECVEGLCFDAQYVCGPDTCTGCCENGACFLGTANDVCGAHGQQCFDCTPDSTTCDNGFCSGPVADDDASVDAGANDAAPDGAADADDAGVVLPLVCRQTACSPSCIPVYQEPCCKDDGTCGCRVLIPDAGVCN